MSTQLQNHSFKVRIEFVHECDPQNTEKINERQAYTISIYYVFKQSVSVVTHVFYANGFYDYTIVC